MSESDVYGWRYRWLPDGRIIAVAPLTFGRARVYIGRAYRDQIPDGFDDGW